MNALKIFSIFFLSLLFIINLNPILSINTNAQSSNSQYNHFQYINQTQVPGKIYDAQISNNKNYYVTMSSNIELIAHTNNFITIKEFEANALNALVWSPDDKYLADGVNIRNATSFDVITSITAKGIAWNPKEPVFTTIYNSQLNIWYVTNFSIKFCLNNINYTSVQWSPSGNYLAAAISPFIDIYNGSTYTFIKRIIMDNDKSTSIVSKIQWSPDSKYLAYSSGEYFIQIVDINSGIVILKLYHFISPVCNFNWSSDQKYLLAGAADGTINLYEMNNTDDKYYSMDIGTKISRIGFLMNNVFLVFVQEGRILRYSFQKELLKADAGTDKNVLVNEQVIFDGSLSVGDVPDNGYSWIIRKIDSQDTLAIISGKIAKYTFNEIGKYSAQLKLIDIYGNSSTDSINIEIFPNSQKPLISIINPKQYENVSGIITINGIASDDIKIILIEIQIDEGGWMVPQGTSSWFISFNGTNYRTGPHQIFARAHDDTQISDIAMVTFYIIKGKIPENDSPPQIIIINPKDGQIISGKVRFQGTAKDNTYIRNVFISYPNKGIDAIGTSQWYSDWDTTELIDGTYEIGAIARDEYDQRTMISIHVIVKNHQTSNNMKPHIGIISPQNDSVISNTSIIEGWAGGENGIILVQIQVNSGIWNSAKGTNSWELLLNIKNSTNDKYQIKARAFDGVVFSDYSIIWIRINNSLNNSSNHSNSTIPQETTTIPHNYFFPILFLFLLICIVIKHNVKLFKKTLIIVITILIFLIILSILIFPENVLNNENNSINFPQQQINVINNTIKYAPDYTSISLRDGSIISNERFLGKVTILYFYSSMGEPNSVTGQIDIISRKYNSNIEAVFFNSYINSSDDGLNKSILEVFKPQWDYLIDRLYIHDHFDSINLRGTWVLIDKKGVLRYTGSAIFENPSEKIDILMKE
jgi:hypothetical protein